MSHEHPGPALSGVDSDDARFRVLFERSPDPTWIIDGSTFVECNAAAVSILGYESKDKLLQTHPSQLSPDIQPDGEASFTKAEAMMALARRQGIHRFEWMHTRADGSPLPAEVTLTLIELQGHEVIYCVWRDISERKRIEAEMRLAASVVQSTREGIVVTDANGIILTVNPAFTEITGYSAKEAIGQTPRLLRSDRHDPGFYEAMWNSLAVTGMWQGEIWNRRKNGEAYAGWLTITSLGGDNAFGPRFVSLFSDVTELRRKDEQIRHQAYHDALTALPNRLLLQDRLSHAIEVARREHTQVAVMFLDLDGFKVVNDSLGHDAGDLLLIEVAGRLTDCLRRSDTIARQGGDEFVVVVAGVDGAGEITDVAEKILGALKAPIDLKGHSVGIGASIGISLFPQDGDDANGLMKSADTAMYRAKQSGRNTFRFFDATMDKEAVERLELEEALRHAIAHDEFKLYYQPKVDLRSGKLIGAEGLIRWECPNRGMVPPVQFIPLAEETGLIVPIGDWVIEEAVRQLARWAACGLGHVRLAINVSAKQFHQVNLAEKIGKVLLANNVSASVLEIELTESAVMADPAHAVGQLGRLRALGIEVSIDDFGTGYSSLSNLKALPFNTVKIDQSFVRGVAAGTDNAAFVSAILGLARALGMGTVAEGVETLEEEAHLKGEDCLLAQGFKYAKALPVAEFEAWAIEHTISEAEAISMEAGEI